jgi:hypothetical protein
MRSLTGLGIALVALVAGVVLVGFAVFWAQDACLDAGGAVHLAARQCELTAGQYVPLFRDRSIHLWFHDGLVAAFAASIVIALLLRRSRGSSPRPSS